MDLRGLDVPPWLVHYFLIVYSQLYKYTERYIPIIYGDILICWHGVVFGERWVVSWIKLQLQIKFIKQLIMSIAA